MQCLCDPEANSIERMYSFMRVVVCWAHIFIGTTINNLAYCDKTFECTQDYWLRQISYFCGNLLALFCKLDPF